MEENLTFDELEKLEEIDLQVDEKASEVNEGSCKECGGKLVKVVENRSILSGMLTFHIIKLRCEKCGKEYLDLEQAKKYDFALLLEKASRQSLDVLSKRLAGDLTFA